MTHDDDADDLGAVLDAIDRLERGTCARCERRACMRAVLRSAGLGVVTALVLVVGVCIALEWLFSELPRFG